MASVVDIIVAFVADGLKSKQVIMLSDLNLYLQQNNISYTDNDLQNAVQQLESQGIEAENLDSDVHCTLFSRI